MKKVIAYVHSHWDREWYRDFEEFRLRLIEVFDKVITELESGELPAFYFDGQTSAIEDYLEIFPEKEARIKKLIKKKKLFVGPFYCSSDEFLTSAESLVRNIYFGMKKSKELDCSDFIAYLSDTFGHTPATASILESFGIYDAALWRGLPNTPADIEWEGIKVTNLIQGYFQDFLSQDISIKKKAEFLKKYLDKIAVKSSDYVLLPIGADHLATPDDINKQIKEINKYLTDYVIDVSTPFEYLKNVEGVKRSKVKGEFLDNSLTFILPGVYSSRIYLKQKNAKSQWLLQRVAEPIQAISAFVYGQENRQNQCDYAHKTLIKNHAHDSIYGCSIDSVHREMITRFNKVDSVCEGIVKRAVRDLSSDSGCLSILNLSNFDYSGAVKVVTDKKLPEICNPQLINSEKGFTDSKLYNIQQIPVTEDIASINEYLIDIENIPAFSAKAIKENNICKKTHLKTTKNSIENESIKFEVKNNKIVVTDKAAGEIYKDFINIIDRADVGDSYNFGALKGDKPILSKLKSFKLLESGPVRSLMNLVLEIDIPEKSISKSRSKKILKHKLSLNVSLCNQSEYLEFEIDWLNKSKDHLLQVEFNLKKSINKTVSEDSLGLLTREFDPDYDIYKNLPASKGLELKTNTRPMQRFVWAQNFGLVTEGLNEYEVHKNKLRLTLLRATGMISNPENPTRGTPAGPPLLTPELQSLGENTARFAVLFTKEPSVLYKMAEEFYGVMNVVFSNLKEEKLLKLDNKYILVYAMKLSGKDLIIRLFNLSDKLQKTNLLSDIKLKSIYEVSTLEDDEVKIKPEMEFKPKELKTIKLTY